MADTPKSQLIADELRAEIGQGLAGKFPPGTKLPPEKDLAAENGVAVETMRRALTALVNEGLIERIHGRGTFVRAFDPIVRNANKRLSYAQWGSGLSIWEADLGKQPEPRDLKVGVEEAPPWVAGLLGTSNVVVRDRVYFVDKKPVQMAVSYYPAEIADGTSIAEADTGPGGAPARLDELGFRQTQFRENVRVRMPTVSEAQRLRLSTGKPVAEIVREAATADKRVVEVTRMVLVGEAYVLQWSFTS